LIRGSPLLSARRNASLRNVAALAIAQPVSPRNVLRSGTPTPTPTPKAYGAVDVHRGRDALGIDIPDANVQMVSQGSLVNGDNNDGDDDDDDDDGDETLSVTEHILKPIETTADFLEWYGKVENQLAEDQDQEVHAYAELLRMRADQCSAMVDCIAEVEALLNKMELNYRRVCEQTDGVKTACSELQIKRDQLVKLSDEIAGQLSVYNSLNQIARLFNAPGDSICLDEEFLPSLERAEEAIRFIESHPSSQDSELYLMRFSQCRMRALTLIKMHALKGFKALSTEVSSEFSKDESSNKAAALYVRFRAAAVSLSPLLHTLHKRSKEAGSTERQILKDVQNAYFQVRRSWLRLYIQETLKSITKEQEEIVVELAAADDNGGGEQVDKAAMATDVRIGSLRDWCAFMMNVCADEYRLYYDFFDIRMDLPDNDSDDQDTDNAVAMSAELRGYLDSVMMVFHEQVRPQIIHESDVAVLAGISITLLTYRYAADNDNAAEAESLEAGQIDDTSAPRDSRSYFAEENGLDAFYAVVDQILQDAQQRLAYKAQSYIRTHISSYKVSKEDSDTISRWIVLCSQLQVTDPEDLEAIAAHASVT
ncbi:Golgi transport complex subunit 3, partial [Dipsacomyces acuminosporus]